MARRLSRQDAEVEPEPAGGRGGEGGPAAKAGGAGKAAAVAYALPDLHAAVATSGIFGVLLRLLPPWTQVCIHVGQEGGL